MREYEVRYKLYPRSRQTRMEKVQAEGRFSAAVKLFCKYGKYPVRVVAVLPVRELDRQPDSDGHMAEPGDGSSGPASDTAGYGALYRRLRAGHSS